MKKYSDKNWIYLPFQQNLKFFLWLIVLALPIWLQSTSISLRSVDGIVYAQVAKELSRISITEWASPTWLGLPFYEHPPLFLWFIAFFFKIFGVSTYGAVLPALILSSLTLWIFSLIVGEFIDRKAAPVFMIVAFLDYSFIKYARNPMLEVPLTFFLALSLLLTIRYNKKPTRKNALLSGLAISGAIASKGIVGLLPIGIFFLFSLLDKRRPLQANMKNYAFWLCCVSIVSITTLGALDVWHYILSKKSFWKTYFINQVAYSMKGRGSGEAFPIIFYLKTYFSTFVPNAYLVLVSLVLFLIKKRYFQEIKYAFLWGILYLFCMFLGFSMSKHSADWYINIHFPGTWLIIGSAVYTFGKTYSNVFKKTTITVSLCLCIIAALFPSVISKKKKILVLFEKASRYSHITQNKRIGNCIGLDPWKGRFYASFYLDAQIAPCHERSEFVLATSQALPNRRRPYEILFSHEDTHLIKPR